MVEKIEKKIKVASKTKKVHKKPTHKSEHKTQTKSGSKANSSKTTKAKKCDPRHKKFFIAAGVLIIIVAVILIVNFIGNSNTIIEDDQVIAYVDGAPIYQSEYAQLETQLPPGFEETISKTELVSQLIDKKLLLTKANQAGINLDDEVQEVLDSNGMTLAQLESVILSQGIDMQEFKDQLLILVYLNDSLFSKITASEEKINNFYQASPEMFIVPASAQTKHVLVTITTERTDSKAFDLINQIKAKYEADNSVFCDLVTEYSEDPGSVENCGEYGSDVFPNFVPEYKELALSLENGAHGVAKTDFGYHLIITIEKTPETIVSLEEATPQIENFLTLEKQKEVFDAYMIELRVNSDIVNCYETPENEMCSNFNAGTTTIVVEETDLAALAQCITDSGAKMYGANWCSHCNNQKAMFEDAKSLLPYVECAIENDPRGQTPACQEAGIAGYPTWVINGQEYPGEQAIETLAQLTAC